MLTPKRRALLEALSAEEYTPVRGLAPAADRDKRQDSRGLEELAESGPVTLETDGRSKRPRLTHEHLVAESIL